MAAFDRARNTTAPTQFLAVKTKHTPTGVLEALSTTAPTFAALHRYTRQLGSRRDRSARAAWRGHCF
jgi:hypothetical protein